jgi:hypothetical protein
VYDDKSRLIRVLEINATGEGVTFAEIEYSKGRRVWITRDPTGVVTRRNVDHYEGDLLTFMGTYDASGHARRLKSFEYREGRLSKAISKYYEPDGNLTEISISDFDSHGRVKQAFGLTRRKTDRRRSGTCMSTMKAAGRREF